MSERLRQLQSDFVTKKTCYENDLICVQNGWKVWPENASESEKQAAFDALLNGQDYTLYPPGYTAEPVDVSGKLQAEPCQEEQKRWWEVWK